MNNFNLSPTSTASWQSLVLEAQNASHIELTEDLQSYLVFLLMRFLYEDQLVSRPVALDFLETLHLSGRMQQHQLQEVGDKCLILSGFFPGLAERRLVRVEYFVNLGQGAYTALSYLSKKGNAQLFNELSNGFVPLVDILQTIRAMSCTHHLISHTTGHKLETLALRLNEIL